MQQNYNSGFYYQLNLTSFPPAFSQATKDALIYDTITDGNGFKVNSNLVSPSPTRSLGPLHWPAVSKCQLSGHGCGARCFAAVHRVSGANLLRLMAGALQPKWM